MTRLEVCERIDVDYRSQLLQNNALREMVTNREKTVLSMANRISELEVQLQKMQQFALAEQEEKRRLKERQSGKFGIALLVGFLGFVVGVAASN